MEVRAFWGSAVRCLEQKFWWIVSHAWCKLIEVLALGIVWWWRLGHSINPKPIFSEYALSKWNFTSKLFTSRDCDEGICIWGRGILNFDKYGTNGTFFLFCNTNLSLVCPGWVWSIVSSHCPLYCISINSSKIFIKSRHSSLKLLFVKHNATSYVICEPPP